MGFLLVSLAMRTEAYTEDLCQCCYAAHEILSTELYLDIFDASSLQRRDRQPETIVEAAAEQHVTLTILTRAAALMSADMTWLCFKEIKTPNAGSGKTLAETFNCITNNSSDQCHFIARSASFDIPGLTFRVSRSDAANHNPGAGSRTSFRDIQIHNPPDTSLLGHVSKFRIAFELA